MMFNTYLPCDVVFPRVHELQTFFQLQGLKWDIRDHSDRRISQTIVKTCNIWTIVFNTFEAKKSLAGYLKYVYMYFRFPVCTIKEDVWICP